MKVFPLRVVEHAVPCCNLRCVEPVAHWKAEAQISHGLFGVFELIYRGCDNLDSTLLEFAKVLFEVSQLLTADRSPVATVGKKHSLRLRRKAQGASIYEA